MPVSRALRRLLHVRAMEEDQQRQTLESAMNELHALQHELAAARERQQTGHKLLVTSFQSSEIADRAAAQVEVETAARYASALAPRIASAKAVVSRTRQEFLDKRLERRQAQTLIEEAEAQDAIETGRREQQGLDETFGALRHRPGGVTVAGPRPLPADLKPERPKESPSIPDSGAKSKL